MEANTDRSENSSPTLQTAGDPTSTPAGSSSSKRSKQQDVCAQKEAMEAEAKTLLTSAFTSYFAQPLVQSDSLRQQLTAFKSWWSKKANTIGKEKVRDVLRPNTVQRVFDALFEGEGCKSIKGELPQRWQFVLERVVESELQSVVRIGLFLSIKKFKSTLPADDPLFAGLHQTGASGWLIVPINVLEGYVDVFQVLPLDTEALRSAVKQRVEYYLAQQRHEEAAICIRVFKVFSEFKCDDIVLTLVNKDKIQEAEKFFGQDEALARAAILAMDPNKYSKHAFQLIKQFNFEISDFPAIFETKAHAATLSGVSLLGWMRMEENFLNEPTDKSQDPKNPESGMKFLVRVLVQQKLFAEALGVCQRRNIDLGLYGDELTKEGLVPAENHLLAKDDFGPTEVYLENKKASDFLTLPELNVKETDVLFVDKIDANFASACAKLKAASVVGIDTEFAGDVYGLNPLRVAIMQAAAEGVVVIFDFLALEKTQELYEFCKDLFADPKIIKVGHSLQSDKAVLRESFKDKVIEFAAVEDVDALPIYKVTGTKVGLADIVKNEYKKTLSKFNGRTNWRRRPLRRSQLHYAAMDAVVVLDLHKRYITGTASSKSEGLSKLVGPTHTVLPSKSNLNIQNEEALKVMLEKNEPLKFLVDTMMKKLASNLRNIGRDAEYAPENLKPSEIVKLAELQGRIILTKDNKLLDCKKTRPLIKISSNDPDQQLQEVIKLLNLKIGKNDLLSRCVKCNDPTLKAITFAEAMKLLKWENQDETEIKEFWQCAGCKQIYWEGGTFDRSKKMFSQLVNSN